MVNKVKTEHSLVINHCSEWTRKTTIGEFLSLSHKPMVPSQSWQVTSHSEFLDHIVAEKWLQYNLSLYICCIYKIYLRVILVTSFQSFALLLYHQNLGDGREAVKTRFHCFGYSSVFCFSHSHKLKTESDIFLWWDHFNLVRKGTGPGSNLCLSKQESTIRVYFIHSLLSIQLVVTVKKLMAHQNQSHNMVKNKMFMISGHLFQKVDDSLFLGLNLFVAWINFNTLQCNTLYVPQLLFYLSTLDESKTET